LTGRMDGDGQLLLADGIRIRVNSAGGAMPAGDVTVCLRPHNIVLAADPTAARHLADQGYNLFSGTIHRSVYFGDAVDYTVELPSRASLRVIAPPSQRLEAGQEIHA